METALDPARIHSLPQLISREKRRHRRRILIWSLVLGSIPLAAGALYLALRPRPVPMAARFRVQPVSRGDVLRDVRATGHVEAVSTVQVGAEISGRIATVEADFNDHVKAGQVLARFDKTALAAQRAQAEASVAAAHAAVAQARHDVEQTRRNRIRAEELHGRHAQSDAEYDNALTAAALAEARLSAAEAQLAAQSAASSLARTNLDHAVIRAPIDGVIITRNIDPGQTVASMLQTPTLFTVAADLRKMRVIAAVDEADIGEVKVAQPASFTVNAWPDKSFAGVVTEVRNSPVIVQDVVTYGVVVEVENPELLLRPGMTASVRIRTASAHGTLRIPSAALRFTPPGQKVSGTALWRLEAGGPRRAPVEAGITDGEFTQLTSASLREGDNVIVELTPLGKKAYGLAH